MTPPPNLRRFRRRRRHRHRSLQQLMDDVVEEILLRLPPDDPACLVRFSAAWRRILTDAAFSGRYRAFHTGLRRFSASSATLASPSPISSPRPSHGRGRLPPRPHPPVRHQLRGTRRRDPINGDKHRLPLKFIILDYPWNAAVVCAAGGSCDHSGCRGGPFRVAVVGTVDDDVPTACIYSSEAGAWSAPTTIQTDEIVNPRLPVALVGDALYFLFEFSVGVLRYDMSTLGLSVINRPPSYSRGTALMPADDGGLGFAGMDRNNILRLGLRKTGDAGWAAPHRIIDLEELLPLGVGHHMPMLMGIADGAYAIFANTDDDVFIIDLKSLKARKVCKRERSSFVFPYIIAFYNAGPGNDHQE
ncbi:hypothetical protein EJB05_14370, partial [Eragrostis curvula]